MIAEVAKIDLGDVVLGQFDACQVQPVFARIAEVTQGLVSWNSRGEKIDEFSRRNLPLHH